MPLFNKLFYNLIPSKNKLVSDDSIYLLNEIEILQIKKKERKSILFSALIGVLMVLALYLPQYYLPSLFPERLYNIPIINYSFNFSISCFIYGLCLLYFEILLLSLLNIYCAHEIALATGFINTTNKNDADKKSLLINVAKEKKNKKILDLGIDPYSGLSKINVFLLNLIFTLKATISNSLFKLFVQRILGRYAFRQLIDMLGIPIYAFWNAWGTRKVLREARLIIMCQNYLSHFNKELLQFRELNADEKSMLYYTLQYIAESKRDFHQNHFYLSTLIIDHFQIPIQKNVDTLKDTYFSDLNTIAPDFKALNEKIILFGFVLDGHLSMRENKRIKLLLKKGIIQHDYDDIKLMCSNFLNGKGL